MMFDPQEDRPIALSPESLIDAFSQGRHLLREQLILIDLGAAGRGNLYERKFSDPFRLQLQQPLDSEEPLENSFGIVQPFDADPHAMRGGLSLIHISEPTRQA